MQTCSSVGISIPKNILSKIDDERGDISRSRYVLRILEKTYLDLNAGTKNNLQLKTRMVEKDSLNEGIQGKILGEPRRY